MTDLLGDYLTQMIAWKNLPPFLDPIPMLGVAMPTVGPSAVPIMAIAKASMAENIALAAQFPLALWEAKATAVVFFAYARRDEDRRAIEKAADILSPSLYIVNPYPWTGLLVSEMRK